MLFGKKGEKTKTAEPALDQELEELKTQIDKAKLSESVNELLIKEWDRLVKTDPSNPEYTIGLTYIEYVLSLPWNRITNDNLEIDRAQRILEAEHYGLKHIKERILEYLAVRTLCSLKAFSILVVDDEQIARSNMEHVLKKEGYKVKTAVNGIEALEKLKQDEFDLILTDLKMEKMDGLQLLESVRRISPHIETVMITGFATVNSAVDALKKGAAHYLSKPIQLDELRAVIRQIHEKRRYLQINKSPVLCFSGPPGTGKTSIGRGIAQALERKFIRLSLAGLRDESELRGHRRTYVGAMSGRIINELKRINSKNPVFMLDEIDKIGQDFRGDTASVLLEILDPEQNSLFMDHYLDIPFDLSSVMFIATANAIQRLPGPLLDRMEVIDFPGYTEREKKEIARHYLIPRQLKEHGLSRNQQTFTESAVISVIRNYTREAGLRNLEREFATICRKLARISLNSGNKVEIQVDDSMVETLLGPKKFIHETANTDHQVGVTTGLVWTDVGGEIIFIEATLMNGNQQLILTGSMGDVLRESAQTALSYIRSHAEQYGIDPDFFMGKDIHIHIPCSAIPKDGPSAGVTIAVALMSLLMKRPARKDIAITGEITLSGRIFGVSGLREKMLGAQRAGIKTVVFPKRNEMELSAIEDEIKEGMKVVFADDISELTGLMMI